MEDVAGGVAEGMLGATPVTGGGTEGLGAAGVSSTALGFPVVVVVVVPMPLDIEP